MLSNWAQSSNNVNLVSFAVSFEIAKRGKPFTDGEYVKDCFVRASEEVFRDFKNKAEIMKKIKALPLSAKTVRDRTAKMPSNVTNMQEKDIQLASVLSLAITIKTSLNYRGNVLQRFALCLSEIKTFLNEKSIDYPELEEDKWLQKFNFMVDTTMKLNLKLQGKGNPAYALLEEVVCYEKKLLLFVEDMGNGKLLHFKNLKQYCDETNTTIEANYFNIVLKNMKDGFAVRFEQFKTNKSTLAFIVNPLNTNTNEINIEPFGIDAGSLQMQLLDLKTKDFWNGKFTELKSKLEELEVQKCMHIAQHKWTALKEISRVEALIFGAWNSLPECHSE
ncbi:hypothetical protein AVEN_275670-1, partial [Araneus ventricosus]